MPIVALTALLAMTGCNSATGGDEPDSTSLDVDGRTFLSVSVTADNEPMSLVPRTQLSLSFLDSRIAANAGCNTMGGDASTDGGVLVLGNGLAMTEMGCDNNRMEQDAWFSKLLSAEPLVALDGNTLTLESKGTVVTMTDDEVASPDRSLTGTEWTLSGVVEGNTATSVVARPKVTLLFAENGEVQFSDSCNSLSATYVVTGNTIILRHIATTLMLCRPAGDVETAVQSVLHDTFGYRMDGSTLTLNNGPNGLTYTAER